MPRVFLLDGTALAYRAHFALANGRLYARDKRRLVCLDLTGAKP